MFVLTLSSVLLSNMYDSKVSKVQKSLYFGLDPLSRNTLHYKSYIFTKYLPIQALHSPHPMLTCVCVTYVSTCIYKLNYLPTRQLNTDDRSVITAHRTVNIGGNILVVQRKVNI